MNLGLSLLGAASLAGCAAQFDAPGNDVGSADAFGSAEEAVAACVGDDLQYDFNAFTASLAVAIANELGRWDALADFAVVNNKLALSATGEVRCEGWRGDSPGGCENIRAILALQGDASASVPYHSPSIFRSKLVGWYQRQLQYLTLQAAGRTKVDKGIFRIKSRSSARYLTVDAYNLVTQATSATATTSQQWSVILDGSSYQIRNAGSGKCLDLEYDTSSSVRLVQRTCSSSTMQDYQFAELGADTYAIMSKYGRALKAATPASSTAAAGVSQEAFAASLLAEQFVFEPYGTQSHLAVDEVVAGVYTMTIRHTGRYFAVDGGQMRDGAVIEQRLYESGDDRYNWYISKVGTGYEIINRRSGKCLDLEVPSSSTGRLVQRTCANTASQRFTFNPTGDGYMMMLSTFGRSIEIAGNDLVNDEPFVQGATAWAPNRQLQVQAIAAGEPHVLTFSHTTSDGPCGDYTWYDITQPNGTPLHDPASSFVQLMFAGGKQTAAGADENPFIAQVVSGNLVAIDPSGYMNGGSWSASASCISSDILYDLTRTSSGKCCVKYSGIAGSLRVSPWNPTTYLCQ